MIRVEYVGVIAIACLLIGAIIGSTMSGGTGRIVVDTAAPSQMTANATAPAPSEEDIKHLMMQIGSTKNYEALVRMGNAAMDQKITTVAIAAYEKALTINPNDVNVITDLGAVYNDQIGDSKKAIDLFTKASKLDPKHVQSRYNSGIAYLHLNDMKNAEKAFNEVVTNFPDSPQATDARHQLEMLKKQK